MLSGSAPVIWHPPPSSSGQGTVLLDISMEDQEWTSVEDEMQSTIRFVMITYKTGRQRHRQVDFIVDR